MYRELQSNGCCGTIYASQVHAAVDAFSLFPNFCLAYSGRDNTHGAYFNVIVDAYSDKEKVALSWKKFDETLLKSHQLHRIQQTEQEQMKEFVEAFSVIVKRVSDIIKEKHE